MSKVAVIYSKYRTESNVEKNGSVLEQKKTEKVQGHLVAAPPPVPSSDDVIRAAKS